MTTETQIYNEGYAAGQKSIVDVEVNIELRDRFAMAALTGLLARNNGAGSECVDASFMLADLMMQERSK